ncbi:MAG: hypothetical protein HOH14_08780 [Gammaproteobacteria bacterium]|jgi:hypothetical protein|nr:hypothetical protein [Gammaproteobacteria bacterium]MBT6043575.1 hypothetical protein [Gammaproteobacteria bacterium]
MKAKAMAILIAVSPLTGLYAAQDNIEIDEGVTVTVPAVEISSEENENALDESIFDESNNETISETSAETSDDNFIPSIRIAEDLPVAFPVDI